MYIIIIYIVISTTCTSGVPSPRLYVEIHVYHPSKGFESALFQDTGNVLTHRSLTLEPSLKIFGLLTVA